MTVTTRPLMQPTRSARTHGSHGRLTRGTPNEDEGVDGGPLTRPPNGYVESKDGLQVVDAVAVAALDTEGRGRYTAPGVLERNKGDVHLILRRCPRHRKHSRRRVEMLRFATQDMRGQVSRIRDQQLWRVCAERRP